MDQGHLFHPDQFKQPEPEADYDPEAWAGRGDISYHSSFERQMPQQSRYAAYGEGIHTGTFPAAVQRGKDATAGRVSERPFIHPLQQVGEVALSRREPNPILPGDGMETRPGRVWTMTDAEANSEAGEALVGQGKHVPYINAAEAVGSISYRSPRENVRTWAESVQADPGASRHHKLQAEQFDLTIPVAQNRATAHQHVREYEHTKQLRLGGVDLSKYPVINKSLDIAESHPLEQPRLMKKPETEPEYKPLGYTAKINWVD